MGINAAMLGIEARVQHQMRGGNTKRERIRHSDHEYDDHCAEYDRKTGGSGGESATYVFVLPHMEPCPSAVTVDSVLQE